MPALPLKLAGALLAGGLAGVAALATLTSAPSPRLAPAGDSTSTSTQQAVETPAPCPSGTVQHGDSCDLVVRVQEAQPPVEESNPAASAEPRDDATEQAPAPAAPAVQPTRDAQANDQQDATESSHEDADHEDATEVEDQGEHQDGSEHESGD